MPKPIKSFSKRRDFSNKLLPQHADEVEKLTQRLVDGSLDLISWQVEMKKLIKNGHFMQLITALGGNRSELSAKQLGTMARDVRSQYKFLAGFANDLRLAEKAGKSLGFAVNRARMYAHASQLTFWKGAIPVKIPQVPRDGKTQCKTNCKCLLDVKYEIKSGVKVAVLVTWILNTAEHCPDCVKLSREWSPLRLVIKDSKQSLSTRQALWFMERFNERKKMA